MLSPLPLSIPFKLPVTIVGHFMVSQSGLRHLFRQVPSGGSSSATEQLRAAWNKELLTCVRDSYVELLLELQRISQDPTASRAEPPVGRHLDGTYGFPPENAYALWPRSASLLSVPPGPKSNGSLMEVGQTERQALVDWLVRPMYIRLVDMPMWKLHGEVMTKASEGMFLAPPGAEQQGIAPPAAVCDFLKAHYKVFAVPWELTKEIETAGVVVKELTPKMLRSLLRTPQVAAAVQSISTQVDLLEYCCADVQVQQPVDLRSVSSADASGVPLAEGHNESSLVSTFRNSSSASSTPSVPSSSNPSQALVYEQATGQWVGSGLRSRQQRTGHVGTSRGLPGALDTGGDAFGLVADFGRAIADLGRGVLEDLSREMSSGSSVEASSNQERTDDTSLDRNLVAELKGLQCPTARNAMAKLGQSELWVGSKDQQRLLPSMASKFVHSLCLDRPHLAELFNNQVFQNVLRLRPFSPPVLAANLGLVLPKEWSGRGPNASAGPWVSWNPASDTLSDGPSADWLRLLWENVRPSSDELVPFSPWPLIPCDIGTPILVRVGFRQVVFIPPKIEGLDSTHSPTISVVEDLSEVVNADVEKWSRSFRDLELQHPWLLPLLKRLIVPVYDQQFLESNALQSCLVTGGQLVGQILASRLLALKEANSLPLLDMSLTPAECEGLFSVFASSTYAAGPPSGVAAGPVYTADELVLLRQLPIYRTVKGSYVSIDQQLHCVVPQSAFMQPDSDFCLQFRSIPEGGSLYEALAIPELQDHEVLARFALPSFGSSSKLEQEAILSFLFTNWPTLKQEAAVIAALKETKFVRTADESQLDIRDEDRLFSPQELLDPENALLKQVFAAELEKFPGGQFATRGWLQILRDAGLRSSTDAELLLECARKVEELGKQACEEVADLDVFETSSSSAAVGVPLQVWTVAGMLVETILGNFASLYGSSFCSPLSQIAFVPAEKGIPSTGGAGGKRVLAAYKEAVLLKDWPLAWTCAPILARAGVVPPEFSWTLLQLRSPPPFSVVLKHLQVQNVDVHCFSGVSPISSL